MTLDGGKMALGALRENRQWSQWVAVVSATLCLFCAGMCFAWSSPSLAILERPDSPIPITSDQGSWIAALLPFGSALGPVLGSLSAKFMGPKQTIMFSSVPYLLGSILIIFATNPSYLYASRFFSGIGVGFGFTAVPIYIGEIAEDRNRGALMILFMLMLGFGGTAVTCIAPYISIQLMASISCVIPILMLASMGCIPDSPYYLMKIGKEDEAKNALKWFRRQKEDDAVSSEMNLIRKSVANTVPFVESLKEIKTEPNPKGLIVIFSTIIAQQFSGAIVISYYQESIYASSGIPISPEKAVILSQVICAIFSIGTIFIIDQWGRKRLLIISSIGCAVSNLFMGGYFQFQSIDVEFFHWVPVIASNILLISFAVGLGPIPYMVLGEIFPSNFKEVAVCIISVGGAIAGFAATKLFIVFTDELGTAAVFYMLSIITFVFAVINFVIMPETMNKTLLEAQQLLMKKPKEEVKKVESYHITCKV